ncbi:MAG: sensor histidine kinase [Bacteroidota bacterium]
MRIIFCILIFSISFFCAFSQQKANLYHLDSVALFYNRELNNNILKKDTEAVFSNGLSLIKTYLNMPEYTKAKLVIKNLNAYVNSKNSVNYYKLINAEADYNKYQFNYAEALKKYLKVLAFFEKQTDKNYLLKIYIDLAEFYRRTADFQLAKVYVNKSMILLKANRVTDTAQIIRFYGRGAAIYNEASPVDSSILFSNKALALAIKVDNYYAAGASYNELGYTYKNLKQFNLALNNYEKAQTVFHNIGAVREEASALQNYIELIEHNDDEVKQRKFTISKGLELLNLIESKNLELPKRRIFKSLADDYFFTGDSLNYFRYKSLYLNEWLVETRKENVVEVKKIQEKFDNEKMLNEVKSTNLILSQRNREIKVKSTQNFIILIALSVFFILTFYIGYLLLLRNKTNKELYTKTINQASLIQEIHHRVKNNLQFINSLLNMQIASNASKSEMLALKESARRIKSMALAHEMLYNDASNQDQTINIKNYLTELINTIDDMVNTNHQKIEFSSDVESIFFKTTDAIALGMISSELISNAIKYAFVEERKPHFSLTLKKTESGEYQLIIRDNGKGLVEKNDTNTLGMRLIDIFSRQLKGVYKFRNDNGLVFELKFKITNDAKH